MRKQLKGKITILVSGDGASIEIKDELSGVNFCDIKMTNKNFMAALGRLAHTPCEMEVAGLDLVGLRHEGKSFSFELEGLSGNESMVTKHLMADSQCTEKCPEGWTPRLYWSSQDSFRRVGDKIIAKTYIERWLKEDSLI